MKRINLNLLAALVCTGVLFTVATCGENKKKGCDKENSAQECTEQEAVIPVPAPVMSYESQKALTPDQVIASFVEGNKRFVDNTQTLRDHNDAVRQTAAGQFPMACVLSCLDSRIPVEDVFDKGIGDLFVARVAGNFVNTDILGSMEFACKAAGAKVVLVLGHQHCGAIKHAIDGTKLGNITAMLANIKPAVEMTKGIEGENKSSNEALVHAVAVNNVKYNIAQIRKKSSVLKEMEDKGEIKIVGAFYDLTTGQVSMVN